MKSWFLIPALCVASLCPSRGHALEQELGSPFEDVFAVPRPEIRAPLLTWQDFKSSPQPAAWIPPVVRQDITDPSWFSMFTNIPGDWLLTGNRAFRSNSVTTLTGIALITGALMILDHDAYRATRSLGRHPGTVHDASHVILRFGDGKTAFGLAAAFAGYGFVSDDRRALRTASQTIEATIASGIVVQLLKRVAGRESPQMSNARNAQWRPFPSWSTYNRHQPRYYAFPSGHMTTAIATVTVIAENYPEATWIRPFGYSCAGLMAVSLVNVGWHWYSDFPLAVAMGYAFGMAAAHRGGWGSSADDDTSDAGLRVFPGGTAGGPGVTLAFCF